MSSKVSSRQGAWHSNQNADAQRLAKEKAKNPPLQKLEKTDGKPRTTDNSPKKEEALVAAAPTVDEAALAKMVDKMVEERLAKMVPPKQRPSRILGRFGVKPDTE